MRTLPDDIVSTIATQLRGIGDPGADFLSFLLVCKQWRQWGLPIFYRNLVLSEPTLDGFADSFDTSKYSGHVRSITVRLYMEDFDEVESSMPMKTLSQYVAMLCRLGRTLSTFQNLRSFSMHVDGTCDRYIPGPTIVALLEALPESCNNLELDIYMRTYCREAWDDVDVCTAIRRLLPRMENVRLRLGTMCCALFGTGCASKNDVHAFQPIVLPRIKSLVINCTCRDVCSQSIQKCGLDASCCQCVGNAWSCLTTALTAVLERQDKLNNTVCYVVKAVLDNEQMNNSGEARFDGLCCTEVRADLIRKETWAYPILRLGWNGSGPSLIRMPGGYELITRQEGARSTVEAGLWTDAVGGSRLPTEAIDAESRGLPSFATGCVKVEPYLGPGTAAEWIAENPTEWMASSPVLFDEEKTHMKLVRAEKRSHECFGQDYLLPWRVHVDTPEGWVRRNVRLEGRTCPDGWFSEYRTWDFERV